MLLLLLVILLLKDLIPRYLSGSLGVSSEVNFLFMGLPETWVIPVGCVFTSGIWSLLFQSLMISSIETHTLHVLESVISKRHKSPFFPFLPLGGVIGEVSTKHLWLLELKLMEHLIAL